MPLIFQETNSTVRRVHPRVRAEGRLSCTPSPSLPSRRQVVRKHDTAACTAAAFKADAVSGADEWLKCF